MPDDLANPSSLSASSLSEGTAIEPLEREQRLY